MQKTYYYVGIVNSCDKMAPLTTQGRNTISLKVNLLAYDKIYKFFFVNTLNLKIEIMSFRWFEYSKSPSFTDNKSCRIVYDIDYTY